MHVDLYSDDIICTTSVYMSIYTCARIECVCEVHICRQAVGLLKIDYYYYCYSCIVLRPVDRHCGHNYDLLIYGRYWSVLFLTLILIPCNLIRDGHIYYYHCTYCDVYMLLLLLYVH